MSQDTADLLKESGKGHWLKERADTVTPKGKGEMQTFWLESRDAKEEKGDNDDGALTPTASEHDSTSDFGDAEVEDEFKKLGLKDLGLDSDDFDEREQRLVRWNAEVLHKLLKQIVARRIAVDARNKEKGVEVEENNDPVLWPKSGLTPLEEFQEIIQLPEFDEFVAKHEPDPETIEIDEEVVGQLNDFVRIIASMYRQNPFHNCTFLYSVESRRWSLKVSHSHQTTLIPFLSVEHASRHIGPSVLGSVCHVRRWTALRT